MDWFSWLSQTPLDPALVYNYGVLFACNELSLNDVAYFDHEFLLSMGITIAKHRLEILKLARKKTQAPKSGVVQKFIRFISGKSRWKVNDQSTGDLGRRSGEMGEERLKRSLSPLKVEWKEIGEEEERVEKFEEFKVSRSPGVMGADVGEKTAKGGQMKVRGTSPLGPRRNMSGPINGGRPLMTRSPMRSGPINGVQPLSARSPSAFGSVDESYRSGSHSPWATLFDDLKPN